MFSKSNQTCNKYIRTNKKYHFINQAEINELVRGNNTETDPSQTHVHV